MINSFINSLLTQPPIVLGRRLYPLSAYHVILLMGLDNAYTKSKTVTRADLLEAVWVCGVQYPWGWDLLTSLSGRSQCLDWGKQFPDQTGEYGFDYIAEANVFEAYIAQYTEFPEIFTPVTRKGVGKNLPSAIPWPAKMVMDVLSHYSGMTDCQAWNMGLNMLASYRASIAEDNGMNIETETGREIQQRIEEAGLAWVPPEKEKAKTDG